VYLLDWKYILYDIRKYLVIMQDAIVYFLISC